ncbi:MAG TPA: hypothetical protein VHD88_02105 [Pyrinomonadaceae bacterium]|nr:hypothetical protein [Pyrinomonadaceae bacterium]
MTERIWIIVAGVFVVVAAVFLWRNNLSATFVTATLGAVAWFLSYRVQLRAKISANDHDPTEKEITSDTDEN